MTRIQAMTNLREYAMINFIAPKRKIYSLDTAINMLCDEADRICFKHSVSGSLNLDRIIDMIESSYDLDS